MRLARISRAIRPLSMTLQTGTMSNRRRLISSIEDDSNLDSAVSEQHTKRYCLNGVGRRSQAEIQTDTGYQIRTDVPTKMGGNDSAPQPVETLIAAWMGCTQATALYVGRHMSPRVIIDKLVFEGIEAARDEQGALSLPIGESPPVPSRVRRVTGTILVSIRGKNVISKEQLDMLKGQTEIRCPVANMLSASGCSMDVEWIAATSAT